MSESPVDPEEPEPAEKADNLAAKARDEKIGKWIGVGVIVTLVAIFSIAGMKGSSGPNDDQAQDACQSAVEGMLKAPGTADFSNWRKAVSSTDTHETVFADVDAQNSFGASLRSSFTCKLTAVGDTWHVVDITGL